MSSVLKKADKLNLSLSHSFASGTLPQADSSSGSFIQYCRMLYLTATAAPLVFSFLLLERESEI